MSSSSGKEARIAERLDRLAKIMRERRDDIVAVAQDIKERMDDRWLIDPSCTGHKALGEAAARLGIDKGELADLVKLVWSSELSSTE